MTLQTSGPGRAAARPGPVPVQRRGRTARRYARLLPMAPACVLLAVFFVGPLVWAVHTATTNLTLTGVTAIHPQSVGLDNFRTAFGDDQVHAAATRTVIFVAACVAAQNGLGLVLAALMQRRSKAVRALVSSVVVGAWVIPEIVAAFVWYSCLQPDGGTLNQILNVFGLSGQQWLVSSPLFSVIIANVWRGTAFSMLIYSAALQDVPQDQMEAASVDGAGAVMRAWHVALPAIRRTASANLLLTTLGTLGVFGLIWAMTAGGPAQQSQTLTVLMYDQAFSFSKLGYGAAISLILLGLGAIFAVAYLVLLRTERKA